MSLPTLLPSVPCAFAFTYDVASSANLTQPRVPESTLASMTIPQPKHAPHRSRDIAAAPIAQPPIYQRNLDTIETLKQQITTCLRKLDRELEWNGSERPSLPQDTDPAELRFTWQDTFLRWRCRAEGTGAAITQLMKRVGAVTGFSYVAAWIISNPLTSFATGSATALSIVDLPEKIRENTAHRLIHHAKRHIDSMASRHERLLNIEVARQAATERIATVMAEHSERILTIASELDALIEADVRVLLPPESGLVTPGVMPTSNQLSARTASASPAVPTDANTLSPHAPAPETAAAITNSKLSPQRPSSWLPTWLAATSRLPAGVVSTIQQPLAAALNTVGTSLSRLSETIGTGVATMENIRDRNAIAQAEYAYLKGDGKALVQALAVHTDQNANNIITRHIMDIRAQNKYRLACPERAPNLNAVRRQLYMGQHIVRALAVRHAARPGTVSCQTGTRNIMVPANLTTIRALLWYVDTAADTPFPNKAPPLPTVLRLADGSLSLEDPQGRFYDFLMQAQTAYTPRMVTPNAANEAGVFRLHDHHPGFPGGGWGVQFARRLDAQSGAATLHMRVLDKSAGFGVCPDRIPMLGSDNADNHIFNTVRTGFAAMPNLRKYDNLDSSTANALESYPDCRVKPDKNIKGCSAQLENEALVQQARTRTQHAGRLAKLDHHIEQFRAAQQQLAHWSNWNPG